MRPSAPAALVFLVLSFAPTHVVADSVFSTKREISRLAEGIYVIRHKDPFPGWVHSNTTVIIGDRQVLVVDSCQTPSAANEDIAQIRQWTNKPVAFLINTHFHGDHIGGNKAYVDAYPSISIIVHPETRAMEDNTGPSLATILRQQAEELQTTIRKRLESGKGADDKPLTDQKKTELGERQAEAAALLAQADVLVYQLPTLFVEQELSIDLGNRTVRVMHSGRGNTIGDIVAFLPKEHVLIAGDLVVHPVPYMFDGYPTEWIKTLGRLSNLDSETIVPGHGEILHGNTYLKSLMELMQSVVSQIDSQLRINPEMPFADVQKAIHLEQFRKQFCGDDKDACGFFDYSVGQNFVELAYHEAKAR